MGLWQRLFGRRPLSPQRIAKISKLAANPFAQPEVRMQKMQQLIDDGQPLAIAGVLRRFAANAQGSIADEEEKKWLEDALVRSGVKASAPLRDYIAREDKLTYALSALKRIEGERQAYAYFLHILCTYGPENYRHCEAKLQLIWQLSECYADADIQDQLSVFLLDHSDDVRWAVLDVVACAGRDNVLQVPGETRVLEYMGQLISDAHVSVRIRRRAAEVLVLLAKPLPTAELNLHPGLLSTFLLDKKRILRVLPSTGFSAAEIGK